MYDNIDMTKTGALLKRNIEDAGYTVRDIQNILHLSCPQPVYRWYKGTNLPSVDHLYVLSKLLRMHMEDLLVPRSEKTNLINMDVYVEQKGTVKRLYEYWSCLQVKLCA